MIKKWEKNEKYWENWVKVSEGVAEKQRGEGRGVWPLAGHPGGVDSIDPWGGKELPDQLVRRRYARPIAELGQICPNLLPVTH